MCINRIHLFTDFIKNHNFDISFKSKVMNKLNCIIIEDEPIAKLTIEKLCSNHELLQLNGSFASGLDAINYLKENPTDLLLLDVQMPDMKGWELLDQLAYIPIVIVISANKENAFDAFQYKVADFIEKPITQTLLNAALLKAYAQFEERKRLQSNREMYVKSNGKLVRIEFRSIYYVENLADYLKIVTEDSSHVIYCTLKQLESRLPSKYFLKIHRSYIINLSKIQFIQDNDVSVNNLLIPIARSQKSEFLDRLNIL